MEFGRAVRFRPQSSLPWFPTVLVAVVLVIPGAPFVHAFGPAAGASQAEQKPDSQSEPATARSPSGSPKGKPSEAKKSETVTIHIQVTAGEKERPVENASIYIRFADPHKSKRAKLVEMNVKTSPEGRVRVPLIPPGKVMIQVIAEHWKTFGKWFDEDEEGQVIKIHLEDRPKWY